MIISNNYNVAQFNNKYSTNFKQSRLKTLSNGCNTLPKSINSKNILNVRKNVKNICKKSMFVLIPLSFLYAIYKTEDRVSCSTYFNNSKVEFFNVKESTKNTIEKSLNDLQSKAKTIDFLDGMQIDVTQRYENLDETNSYRRFLKQQKNVNNVHGSSFYSDGAIPKMICIQESAHNDDKIRNLLHNFKFSSVESIDFTLMHEIGHHFDKFYGHDYNANFVQKREAMLSRYANQDSLSVYEMPKKEEDIMTELIYSSNSGLSDKSDFKEAFLKDLRNIAQLKKQGNSDLASNINYFIANIDFDKEITERTVLIHDNSRAEVYANLFSYAIGKDDGEKEIFTNNFKNSYEIVKKDVFNKLGIK